MYASHFQPRSQPCSIADPEQQACQPSISPTLHRHKSKTMNPSITVTMLTRRTLRTGAGLKTKSARWSERSIGSYCPYCVSYISWHFSTGIEVDVKPSSMNSTDRLSYTVQGQYWQCRRLRSSERPQVGRKPVQRCANSLFCSLHHLRDTIKHRAEANETSLLALVFSDPTLQLRSDLILRTVPLCMFCFGLVMTMQGLVQSYGGLIATRFFLGLTEAGIFPGCE